MATGFLSAAVCAEIATLLEIDLNSTKIARCYKIYYTTVAQYCINLLRWDLKGHNGNC